MTISFVASDEAEGTIVPAAPSVADDDFLIALLFTDNNNLNVTPPAGWSLVHSLEHSGASLESAIYTKVASSESGSYNFNGAGNSTSHIIVLRSSVAGTFSVATESILQVNSSATSTNTAIAALDEDMMIFYVCNAAGFTVSTAPSSMTEAEVTQYGSRAAASYYELLTANDASYSKTLTWSGSNQSIVSALAIRHAPDGGATTILPFIAKYFRGLN